MLAQFSSLWYGVVQKHTEFKLCNLTRTHYLSYQCTYWNSNKNGFVVGLFATVLLEVAVRRVCNYAKKSAEAIG